MIDELIEWYNNEFKADKLYINMSKVSENSPWHRERNIAVHTDMVFQNYLTLIGTDSDHYAILGGLAVIFHDTGKPIACNNNGIKFKPERGNYLSFGGHEQISARIWEDYAARNWTMLVGTFNLAVYDIYAIGWMIEYHLPWGVKKTDKINQIARSAIRTVTPKIYTSVLLADTLGRISDDGVEKRANVRAWIDNFHTTIVPPLLSGVSVRDEDQPILIMPIGASGSGKSTLRENLLLDNPELVIYSWDDLRLEFYSSNYDEAYKLATEDNNFGKKVNARFMEMVKTGKDIYVDNINVSKKRRAFFVREARRKGYFVRAVIFPIELDVLRARQETRTDKTVPDFVVKSQYRAIQVPQFGEFDDVEVMGSNLPNLT